MSEKGGRDSWTRRSSFRKSLSEAALPEQYLELLEEKRRQLDESIHKYVAAKERDYKSFEKELKEQYRETQGHDSTNGVGKRRNSSESTQGNGQTELLEAQRVSAVDALLAKRGQDSRALEADDDGQRLQDRSTIAGLKDRRTSVERDKDFLGLFTPPYLPALDDRHARDKLERTSSAPTAPPLPNKADGEDPPGSLERANSDSMVQAKPKRPSHLALVQRTSSSGSSADGKLASAMKSPTQRPKRKRVSLAVGDSIVAPSDSVPLALSHNSTPSHSRIRYLVPEREQHISAKEAENVEAEEDPSIESSMQTVKPVALSNEANVDGEVVQQTPPATTRSSLLSQTGSPRPSPSSSKIDPDGDLFDLENEDSDAAHAQAETEELDSALESDDADVTGRIDPTESDDIEPDATEERYDPTTGSIPVPEDSKDSAVPYLAFGPGSAVASQQPTQPGFRRPSVVHDPIFRGENYKVVEEDAVENDVYGSSFNRPSSKGSFTAGSLGESYMAQHAEEMMKLRSARQQAQVRS